MEFFEREYPSTCNHINNLPLESFIDILLHVDGVTLGICRRVCKKWKKTIDDIQYLWDQMCVKEFRYSALIAKKITGRNCNWYHIYRNLHTWSIINKFERSMWVFYRFNSDAMGYALDIDYGVLALKDYKGILVYDMGSLRNIPVVVPDDNCMKIANNDFATVLLLKSGIFLQKVVDDTNYMSEAFFKADNFVLFEKSLYFFNNRDVFKCDLNKYNLTSKLIHQCEFDIKEIQYSEGSVYLFTHCGKIVTLAKDKSVRVKEINCPPEWLKQIKHIAPINDKNYVCYSRNIFLIETDTDQHLYLEFPPISALFNYGHFVLIGTKTGEILLYRLSSQKHATTPVFEKLATLPDGQFAVHLDVCERKAGPVIVASTCIEIFVLEYEFFPMDRDNKLTFSVNKVMLYKRMIRLRDRLRMGVPAVQAVA